MALLPTTNAAGSAGHLAHSNQAWKKLNGAWVDVVADYGAAGNGVADDTTAINNAITAAAALGVQGGATVYFPPGTYSHSGTITGKSNVRLLGAGRYATILKRSANVPSVSMYGADTDNRCFYAAVEQMLIHGNDFGSTLLDCVYASQLMTYNVAFFACEGRAIDLVETWDSNFTNTFIEFCGGDAVNGVPAIHIRNARASSGFGSSVDNTNEIRFTHLHLEQFRAGAVRVEAGFGSANPNGIYLFDVKTENHVISASEPFIFVAGEVDRFHLQRLYAFAGEIADGGAVNVIQNECAQMSSLRDIFIANAADTSVASGILIDTGGSGSTVVDHVYGQYTTNPTGAHITVASAGDLQITNIKTNSGTLLSGYDTSGVRRVRKLGSNGTTSSTTLADIAGLMFAAVQPGDYTLELHGVYQSSATTNGPRFAAGGTATVSSISGTVSMDTSTTASTTTVVTAANTAVGTNPGSSATSFRIQARFGITVSAAGTLGVRWNSSNASATGTLLAGSYATLTKI